MKKILIGIFSIILGFVGFSFSNYDFANPYSCYIGTPIAGYEECNDNYYYPFSNTTSVIRDGVYTFSITADPGLTFYNYNNFDPYIDGQPFEGFPGFSTSIDCSVQGCKLVNSFYFHDVVGEGLVTFTLSSGSSDPEPSTPEITVYYNNGNSVENITCDGTQAIQINGLSTITSTNTFTPYYNISYTDEDNQKLTESYSKSNLYLSGGLFKKTYTGDNERILTDTIESPNSVFSGYLPTFEITGGIEEVSESGNIFNNFAENSVKFTLSNIPSYIQYVILLFILFFILGFIRKFRRK